MTAAFPLRRTLASCAVLCAASVAGRAPAAAQAVEPVSLDTSGPHAAKLIILLVVLGAILFGMRQVRLPEVVRAAAIWLGALAVLLGVYAYRVPLETAGREIASVLVPGMAVNDGNKVMVRRGFQGHFVIGGAVDGAPVNFIFDTGASLVVLAAEDASRAGFHPEGLDYRVPVMTAAGMTEVAPVILDEISVGSIRLSRVRAAIAKPGDLGTSLLGMTFLNRLSGYEVRRDRLVLNP
ncbi:TIGR02281 family clan AA aspartic protease [Acuticoccus sp. MNP-M23]|uniref:retropepsin-like aspartic protease family protein n=1 Tax=Acuticoccus sp. MNP-M23 TaxID=3072793 RepID=UPI0028154E61|nr:TIGR02281 family clan AA aspartic protease [Acuticoccus sp. MNP-M23]WMS42058.1 TIGR02281 family clan AA aspartic protease [Acuticoccus sp. MNP-M23]